MVELLVIVFGAFFIGIPLMLIVLLVKVSDIREDVEGMKGKIDKLLSRGDKAPAKVEAKAPAPEPKPAPVPPPQIAPAPAPSPVVEPEPPPKPKAWPEYADAEPREPEPPTAVDLILQKIGDWLAVRGDFAPKGMTHEFAFATRWLVRVGVLLVASSVVYFIKLSVDRGWMGPTWRVASTIAGGAAAAVAGTFLVKRTRYGIIGHAVAALGVVALYMGFGLGHRYFDPPVIASAEFAFAALFGVTVFAGFVSVVMPSSFIAVMSVVGGYLVPVIAGRDTASPFALCAYLLVIDAMAFFVARVRRWSALDFLSATLAYATMSVWCGRHPHLASGQALAVFSFFTLVHALYMVGVVVDSGRRGRAGNAVAWTGLALNACAYVAYLLTHFRAGFFALVAAYLAVAAWAKRSGRIDRATFEILLVFAVAFLSIVPVLVAGRAWWPVAWSAIAVAASEAEARTDERILGVFAHIVFAAAALFGLSTVAPPAYGLEPSRGGALEFAALSGTSGGYWQALILRAELLWTIPVAAALIGRRGNGLMRGVALVTGFFVYSCEARVFGEAFLPELGGGSVTLAWFLLAFAGVWFGIVRRIRGLRVASLVLLAVSVGKLLVMDTASMPTPPRVAVFAISGVLLIVGAFLYVRFRERFVEDECEK